MAKPLATHDPDSLKWHGDRPLAPEARQRLIDAGLSLLTDDGVAEFSIGRIASAAGVTRPTVYSHFDSRDALLREVVLFAAQGAHTRIARRIQAIEDPREIPVELVVATLQEFRAHSLLRKLLRAGDADPALAAILTHPELITGAIQAMDRLAKTMRWSAAEAREAAELISRMTVSFLAAPEPRRSEAELRGFLKRRLDPALGICLNETST